MLPLLNVVEGTATLCIPGVANDHHQVAHMPATGKLQEMQWCKPQWLSPQG